MALQICLAESAIISLLPVTYPVNTVVVHTSSLSLLQTVTVTMSSLTIMKFISSLKKTSGNVVRWDFTMKLFSLLFSIIYPLENDMECEDPEQNITSTPEQNTDSTTSIPRVEQTFNTTAAIVIPAVVIIVLAVISVIIVYFCLKKKKVKASDMTL